MSQPTVAILGASRQRHKFGNISVRAHAHCGYRVFPVNPQGGTLEGLTVYPSLQDIPEDHVDRISVYLPPEMTMELLDDLVALPCDELWLNPGAESPALVERLKQHGLEPILGCSIVNLGVSPADFP